MANSSRLSAKLVRSFVLAAIGLPILQDVSAASDFAISGFTSNGVFTSGRSRGFRFRADRQLRVDALAVADISLDGILVPTGTTAIDVALWTDDGDLLTHQLVAPGTGATLQDGYRLSFLTNPVFLHPGTHYRIAADMADVSESFSGGDLYGTASVTSTSYISMIQQVDGNGSIGNGFVVFPDLEGEMGVADLGANLLVTVVPEPSGAWLCSIGAGLCLPRQRLGSNQQARK